MGVGREAGVRVVEEAEVVVVEASHLFSRRFLLSTNRARTREDHVCLQQESHLVSAASAAAVSSGRRRKQSRTSGSYLMVSTSHSQITGSLTTGVLCVEVGAVGE